MQLRRLAALERQKIIDEHDELEAMIADYNDILAKPERQRDDRQSDELAEIVDKYGDDRRTKIDARSTATCRWRTSSPRRTSSSPSPAAATPSAPGSTSTARSGRGGKGVRGASLRGDDMVDHFFTTTSHHWLLFFTNLGRVYRAKAYELPDAGRDAKGQHVANLLAFQPDEQIAQVLDVRDYAQQPYLVLATKNGLVKKTRLGDYDSPRSGGLIAINLRDGDELVGADLASQTDDLLLVSRKGQSVRFHADRRAAAPDGPRHLRRDRHEVPRRRLAAVAQRRSTRARTPTCSWSSRTAWPSARPSSDWNAKGRGGLGVAVAKITERNGDLVGALTVDEDDEVLVIMEKGNIVRSPRRRGPPHGPQHQGVKFANAGQAATRSSPWPATPSGRSTRIERRPRARTAQLPAGERPTRPPKRAHRPSDERAGRRRRRADDADVDPASEAT